MNPLRHVLRISAIAFILVFNNLPLVFAAESTELEARPDDPYFSKFEPVKAPAPKGLLLQHGDRVAIIGDSITEQRMYSRIIETYLTVCVPQLKITTRQFGWSGETAEGFLHRMTNDCLRFQPTIATLCYVMNDHRYRAYDEQTANWYSNNYASVASSLKDSRSEEHTSELQSPCNLVCRLLLEKKKKKKTDTRDNTYTDDPSIPSQC